MIPRESKIMLRRLPFLLSNDFKIGRKAEQRLRWLPLSDMAENR
jgi:hypothetical protein